MKMGKFNFIENSYLTQTYTPLMINSSKKIYQAIQTRISKTIKLKISLIIPFLSKIIKTMFILKIIMIISN